MKNFFLIAICIATNIAFVSCTNDETETKPTNNNVKNVVADGGNQEAPIPPPKPK